MISMLSLAVAMIYQFGDNDFHFKFVMVTLTGMAIGCINFIMAIFMIVGANKKLKQEIVNKDNKRD